MYFLSRFVRRLFWSFDSKLYRVFLLFAISLASSNIHAQVSANFTISKDKGCAPLYVLFSNTSTGNQDSCFWNLGINGNTSDVCSPSAIFNQAGTYNVTLTIFKNGATSSVTKTITVFKDPISSFDALPRTGCVPFNVQFSDLSTPGDAPISSWLWDMGDGRTVVGQNPLHTYTFSGNLTVSLIVKDTNGCKNTLTLKDFIKKSIAPVVDFLVNKSQSCLLPFTANFQSNVSSSSYPLTYKWIFGANDTSTAINPSHIYSNIGNYNVSLKVTDKNNCTTTKTIIDAVKVEKFVVNASVPTPICANTSVVPTVNSTYSTLFCNWNFGNGTTSTETRPTVNYSSHGTYTVNLLATNQEGCRDSMTQNVVVNIAPTIVFTANQTKSCSPFTVNFTNTSTNAISYLWVISSPNGFSTTTTIANPSIALPRNGYYDVKLIATSSSGCEDVLDMPKYIWIGPNQMEVTADKKEGCAPLKVSFNTIFTNNWSPTSITWDFGDGTISTGESPIHTYTAPGDYFVKVKAIYPTPCDSLFDQIGPIHVGSKVPFNGTADYDKVCVHKETVTFEATGGLPTTIFTWLFGDGNGEGRKATHIYQDPSQPDTFAIKLIADNNTCKDTIEIKKIFVAYPKANFHYISTCNSQTVDFVNTSKGYTSATWNFGDGTIISTNDKNVSHTYSPDLSTVEVTLIVYNDSTGCLDSMVIKINFFNVNSLRYTLSNKVGCKPLNVTLTAPNDTSIQNYIWALGNGNTVLGNNYDAVYPFEGKYEVRLFIKYKNGCLLGSSQTDSITVLATHAKFDFDKISGCVPAIFNFTDSSYSKNAAITSFNWNFEDGYIATGNTTSHTFNTLGVFPVKLTVENSEGCRDSITKPVLVSLVKADFDIDKNDVCSGKAIKFINKSSTVASTYLWDFGDGTTSSDSTPTHIYSQEKKYTVSLKVTDGTGCEDILVKPNLIRIKNIHVNFSASQTFKTCPDLITNFQLQAPANLQIKNIIWDFGNGNTSNDNNPAPQGVYTRSDSFDVKLIVVDNNNCTDTVFKKDYIIVSGPQGDFSFIPDFGCAPINITFTANFKNTTTTIWDFGNGDTKLDNTLSKQHTYTYKREGEYTPTLILKDNFGCTVNVFSDKKVNIARLFNSFKVDKTTLCDVSEKVEIQDSIYTSPNSPIKEFYWSYTDATNTTVKGVGDTFFPIKSGQYLIRHYAENTFGCINRDSIKINVYTSPIIAAIKDKLICKGESVPLSIVGNTTKAEWSPTSSLSVNNSLNVIAKPSVSTIYVVKTYNVPQCPIYDTVEVEVKTKLTALAYPDTILCIGDTLQLHAQSENTSLNITKITWQSSSTISNANDPNPLAYPKINTTYFAYFENGKCDVQKIPVQVDVKPLPTVKAGEDHVIIKGSAVQIDATSPNNVTYVWSPDYNLSCSNCQTPTASPETETSYLITATNEFGCKATDKLSIRVIEDCIGKIVYVPNTFTPNADGQNDILKVFGPGVASIKQFRIFNRWGQMVFDTNDAETGWDGKFNGAELNPGVYMYYIDVECINGERTIKKGDVTLLK